MLLPPNKLTQLSFPPSPLDLGSAKQYLQVETPDSDELIADLIEAATAIAIQKLGRSLLTTQWQLQLDYLPMGLGPFWAFPSFALCGRTATDPSIQLPRPPLISVTSISYVDQSGVEQTLDPASYIVSPGSPGRLAPKYGQYFPFYLPQIASVRITYTAGYGNDPAGVPRSIIQAIRLIVANLYNHRFDDTPMSPAVDALLSPHWWPAYA